ncbi:hypothetical protein TWF696_006616 [Orbilia brochopaga]|uniref:Alpha/beta hydrolase fold-3 domain-containing protein n=1 Tax=Orbilia brochopaga TaxID=3140254 RepID=A0AAV9UQ51_9PEZI
MRLPRLLLPATAAFSVPAVRSTVSRPRQRLLRLCCLPPCRNYSTDPSPYPARFPRGLDTFYHPQYVNFYTRHLAGKLRYNPFDHPDGGISRQYPCQGDYQRSSPAAKKVTCEDIVLSRNATGSINLRIYNSRETTAQSPVILYLPSRGTNPTFATNEHHIIAYIAQLTNSTVVSVGYRISRPFPLSLHDASAALDWVRERLCTVDLETYAENLSGRLIAVLGTGLGGSLALSIGISEGRESGIIAAGAWAPIMDWAFDPLPGIAESPLSTLPRSIRRLDEYIQDYKNLGFGSDDVVNFNSLRELPQSQLNEIGLSKEILSTVKPLADNPFLSTDDLKRLRSRYLATAEDFTDPFVSPLYWFTSSGVNIWTELLSLIEETRLADPERPPQWISRLESEFFERRSRKAKSYPPLELVGKLTVPALRIVNGDGDILHDQIDQFVRAARDALYPAKPRTIDDVLNSEADDLKKQQYNSDVLESIPRSSEVESACDIFDSTQSFPETPQQSFHEMTQVLTPTVASPSKLSPADFFVQHEVKEKAAHCLITAAGEIQDGVEEAEKMAAWLLAVFNSEPKRANQWKTQKEHRRRVIEQLETERRRRRLFK